MQRLSAVASLAHAEAGEPRTAPVRLQFGFPKEKLLKTALALLLVGGQTLTLVGVSMAGRLIVDSLRVPIPGNLVGMVLLFALFAAGILKVAWFEATGSFLIKHLSFFFIPITVGLMDAGALLAASGVAILVTLVVSAAVGVLLSGTVSQLLLSRSRAARTAS